MAFKHESVDESVEAKTIVSKLSVLAFKRRHIDSPKVKIHSIKIKGPKDKGPKTLRIFQNQPNTLDFDKADSMGAAQDIEITEKHLSEDIILLKFVKFQNVTNMQFFFKDNQSGDDVTQIDHLCIIGTPIDTTNMKDFKRVSGKKGESE